MSHVLYPTVFPVQCAIDLVSLVRGGTLKDNIPEFALHLWNVQGYLQFATLGLPANTSFGMAAGTEPTDEQLAEVADSLEIFVSNADSVPEKFGAAATDANLDPATILMFIQMATQIIELIKNLRRKK